MPRYDFRCPVDGTFEVNRPISEASEPAPCPGCGGATARIFTPFQFSEDRRRFWRNKQGTRYHHQIGGERPETRKEEAALLKSRDQEMVPWSEVPAHFKRAQEASTHYMETGEQLAPDELAAYVNEPKEPEVSVESQLANIGYSRDRGMSSGVSREVEVGA